MKLVVALGLALLASLVPPPVLAEIPSAPSAYCFDRELDDGRPRPICIHLATYDADVCDAIARDAALWNLPPGYFARLIWQESHFDANAVSWAGAEGIAQFMPSTGRLQDLRNAYDPAEALYRSARYLDFLDRKFGNLGLAAAAYNGGENAVARFIAGTGYLAEETLDYVDRITGLPITDWLAGPSSPPSYDLAPDKSFHDACIALATNASVVAFTPPTAVVLPWGIQLAQFFSPATARRNFARLQQQFAAVLGGEDLMLVAKRNPNFGRALRYTVEIGRDDAKGATSLCAGLRKAGGACLVVRND
jgi:hypothetical protein